MLHSVGGLHVGAGVGTFIWILVYMSNMYVTTTFEGTWQEWTMRVTIAILSIGLSIIILTAMRPIRERYHNLWEYTHRFLGWFTLLNLVLHVVAKAATSEPTAIFHTPLPYLTFVCLISVFYIWFTVQKVRISTISGKGVAIIKFPGRPTLRDGTFARVSTDFLQWHAFSVAMTNHSKRDFAIIVGAAGDWTRSLVNAVASGQGPTMMWIRGVNPPGFMHMHRTFFHLILSDHRRVFQGGNSGYGRRNCTLSSANWQRLVKYLFIVDREGSWNCVRSGGLEYRLQITKRTNSSSWYRKDEKAEICWDD